MGLFNNDNAKQVVIELARNNNCEKEVSKELEWLSRKGYLEPLFCYSEIIKVLKAAKISFYTCGSIGYLLTAYLLGITDVNPKDYNLPYCFFNAFKNNFIECRIRVDSSKYDLAREMLEATLKKQGYRFSSIGHQFFIEIDELRSIWLSPSNSLKRINKYEKLTNIDFNEIPFGDNKAIGYMLEMDGNGLKNMDEIGYVKFINKQDYLREFAPKTFLDFARVNSLISGNIRGMIEYIPEELHNINASIEEVYDKLKTIYDISTIDAIKLIYDCYHRKGFTEGDDLIIATHHIREDIMHDFSSMSACLLTALQDAMLYYKLAYMKIRINNQS